MRPSGKTCPKLERLSPQMHMRQQRNQRRLDVQHNARLYAVIGIARWDFEANIGRGKHQYTLTRRLMREHEADAAVLANILRARLSVRRVVKLKNQIAARFDEFRLARCEKLWDGAGTIAGEELPGTPVIGKCGFRANGRPIGAPANHFESGSRTLTTM